MSSFNIFKNWSTGRRISFFRDEKGLTQAELGEIVNLGSAYISQIETGSRRPALEALIAIAEAIDVNPDFLRLKTDVPTPVRLLVSGDERFSPEAYELARAVDELPPDKRKEIFAVVQSWMEFLSTHPKDNPGHGSASTPAAGAPNPYDAYETAFAERLMESARTRPTGEQARSS